MLRAGEDVRARVSKPVVGITTYVEPARWGNWQLDAALIPYMYVQALDRAGARPLLVPPSDDGVDETLDALDGLLLSGGADLDPESYGAAAHPQTTGVRPDRDRSESLHKVVSDFDLDNRVDQYISRESLVHRARRRMAGYRPQLILAGDHIAEAMPEVGSVACHGSFSSGELQLRLVAIRLAGAARFGASPPGAATTKALARPADFGDSHGEAPNEPAGNRICTLRVARYARFLMSNARTSAVPSRAPIFHAGAPITSIMSVAAV